MTTKIVTDSASDIPREVVQAGSTLGTPPCHCEAHTPCHCEAHQCRSNLTPSSSVA